MSPFYVSSSRKVNPGINITINVCAVKQLKTDRLIIYDLWLINAISLKIAKNKKHPNQEKKLFSSSLR